LKVLQASSNSDVTDWRRDELTLPEVGVSVWGARSSQLALTVLYHPDPERIGDIAPLDSLRSRGIEDLGRLAPNFHRPVGDKLPRPLGDRYLSRTPVEIEREDGGIRFSCSGNGNTVKVNGKRLQSGLAIDWAAVAQGVLLSLSHRVVLLLHPFTDEPGVLRDASLIGESDAIRRVRALIAQVATTDTPVLLLGESGTGKELVARAIQRLGGRAAQSFVSINMAALPTELAAAELFGAERGAFTGAEGNRSGYFRLADGGTLFLDEIGACSSEVQPLLLRALQLGEVQTLGGGRHRVDVRVIAATDADLADQEGNFSTALRHRLSGFEIHLPPLRQRREDLGRLLCHFFPRALLAEGGGQPREVSRWVELVEKLGSYHWPGNVRELANCAQQLAIASADQRRLVIPDNLLHLHFPQKPPRSSVGGELRSTPTDIRVKEAMLSARWEIARAARELEMSRQALYRRIESIPELRVAADIPGPEVESVYHACQGDLDEAALRLQVSRTALRRRWRAMDLVSSDH
jgi:two-component system nitrogen regulation response regulator GlnG